MKNLKSTKKTFIAIYLMLIILLSSCTENIDNTQKTESGISLIGKYEVLENGMRYIVYREIDGGLFIINTTKDSLETELARKLLYKNNK